MSSTAIATGALALSAMNNVKLDELECKLNISTFNSQASTIVEKQEYASCINMIYPQTLSADTILGMKILAVLFIIGFIYGFWKERHVLADGIIYGLLSGVTFLVLAVICLGILSLFIM